MRCRRFAGIVSPKKLAKELEKTQHRTSAQVLTKLTEIVEGERRIRHQPPRAGAAGLAGVARHRARTC